jgi:hypothetical protein
MPYGNNSLHVCPNDLFPITGAKYFWLPYTAIRPRMKVPVTQVFLDTHFNQTKAHYLLPTQFYGALNHTQNRAPGQLNIDQ